MDSTIKPVFVCDNMEYSPGLPEIANILLRSIVDVLRKNNEILGIVHRNQSNVCKSYSLL
jgi:hypothetical protein